MNLADITKNLKTQDNRSTSHPMFCVQKKVRDVGYDANYATGICWHDAGNEETVYDDDKDMTDDRRSMLEDGDEWDKFGYVDRWETVTVCFTEAGCNAYLAVDGHNVKASAFRGEIRIYVESFYRNLEMITVRELLLSGA